MPGKPQKSPGLARHNVYLEHIANVYNIYQNISKIGQTCEKNAWFVVGECENGHRFAKELACGKEWCRVCGEDGSMAHNRRLARWLPKIQEFEASGYFVFTIPEELRAKYRTKKALAGLGHRIQELLRSYGYARGLRRWHFFGDRSVKYHPHLNILVDGGYLSREKLKAIKRDYARILDCQVVDVHYHYRRSPAEQVHTLKYVTRATFRDYKWNIELAMSLRGFRNMCVWGRGLWTGAPCWFLSEKAGIEGLDVESVNKLATGVCPVCSKPLLWGKALPFGLLGLVEKKSLGAGYYRLEDIRPPPGLPREVKRKLYWMELVHRAEVQVANEKASRDRALELEYLAVLEASYGNSDGLG